MLLAKQNLNFMQGFKSAILPKVKNLQNGTFEPFHEIQKTFGQKAFFGSIMKVLLLKNFQKMSKEVQKEDFLKTGGI